MRAAMKTGTAKAPLSTASQSPPIKGNVGLAERYREAWQRISAGLAEDRPFEAIAIAESIISNRLRSYLFGGASLSEDEASTKRFVTTAELIRRVKAKAVSSDEDYSFCEMLAAWLKRRNSALHGLVSSYPGLPPMKSLEEFLSSARRTAVDGAELGKEVSKWHRRKLREYRKLGKG